MKSLISTMQSVVLESDMSAREIAEKIGKPYPTLLRELNPYDQRAKLGMDTFFDIVRATGNVEPLRRIAEELGYRLTPADGNHMDEPIFIYVEQPVEDVFANSPF